MKQRLSERLHAFLERKFPEKRLFLRSDTDTKFIRLKSSTQAIAWTGGTLFVAWGIVATAILLMDMVGSGSLRDQALREQQLYENRLNQLSGERDARATEARLAQERFATALRQISEMQTALLASEDRRMELETGIDVVQTTLRRTLLERDEARAQIETSERERNLAAAELSEMPPEDIQSTIDFLTSALNLAATERDQMAAAAFTAEQSIEEMMHERRLIDERNDRIFEQLEDAVTISMAPLDNIFREAGLPPDQIIEQIRQGYSGQGGPLTPLRLSTRGEQLDPDTLRANGILDRLDRLNLYRIAVEKAPFALPVRNAFRFTSGFGMRWGRMHSGADFAASHGTPIYATADGVVIHAEWSSGYGRLIKIQHEFGIETRYAHLSSISVSVGQRVSRGDRIGAMGSSGRSTGTHLHYEVRVGGEPVNPMIYIKAADDVF